MRCCRSPMMMMPEPPGACSDSGGRAQTHQLRAERLHRNHTAKTRPIRSGDVWVSRGTTPIAMKISSLVVFRSGPPSNIICRAVDYQRSLALVELGSETALSQSHPSSSDSQSHSSSSDSHLFFFLFFFGCRVGFCFFTLDSDDGYKMA